MSRTRWLVLAAVLASTVVFSGLAFSDGPAPWAVDTPASTSPSDAAGSIEVTRVAPPVVTAVDPGRAPVLARAEARQTLRVLFTALVAVAIACAAIGRRGRSLRRVLELAIRANSAFNGPAPGRRAPPRPRPLAL